MALFLNLTFDHSGLRQPLAIERNKKQAPLPALEIRWQREKLLHALNADTLSGSFHSRTPWLGGAVADFAGFRHNSTSFENL
jgi:hypothetical protein